MSFWYSSSRLSPEEIESPGPGLIDVLLCSEEATSVCLSVWMGRVCGGGSYFGTIQTEMGSNPRRMQIALSTYVQTHTHWRSRTLVLTNTTKKNLHCGWVMSTSAPLLCKQWARTHVTTQTHTHAFQIKIWVCEPTMKWQWKIKEMF